ncbi:hypothetical protein K2X33_10405 [bacterium]|nr:hypothetical protein [bacterium]
MRLFAIFFLLAAPAWARLAFTEHDLKLWLESPPYTPGALPPAVRANAARFRWILSKGFLHELHSGYMEGNALVLRELGVPADQIHMVGMSSLRGIEENAVLMRGPVYEFAARGPEPVIFLAHSKGAAESLGLLTTDPEFEEQRVKAFFSLQGAYNGSGVADAFYFWDPAYRRELPSGAVHPQHLWTFGVLSFWGRPFVKFGEVCGLAGGLKSLTHVYSARYWESVRARCQNAERVAAKSLFIRTVAEPHKAPRTLRPASWYLHRTYGANDALLTPSSQVADWLRAEANCPILLSNAHHLSLTHRGGRGVDRSLMEALVWGLSLSD